MRHRKVPAYSLHAASGQARVRIDGRSIYLGIFGSQESKAEYARIVGEWLQRQPSSPKSLTVQEAAAAYDGFGQTYYLKGGKPTSEIHVIRAALNRLNEVCGSLPLSSLAPRHLKAVQRLGIEQGLTRKSINHLVNRLRRFVRWCVSEELVAAGIVAALETVQGLRRGRSGAKEPLPVRPVELGRIDSVRLHAAPAVASAIALQSVTGMRPGELLALRLCDVDQSGEIWLYVPEEHKLTHLEKSRIVCIGPKGQEILRRILPNDTQAYVFSPLKDKSRPFTVAAYRRHITRICDEKGIGRWAPNQLRHTFATLARKVGGIEAARASLGHSSSETTEIYAERDLEAAKQIAKRIG